STSRWTHRADFRSPPEHAHRSRRGAALRRKPGALGAAARVPVGRLRSRRGLPQRAGRRRRRPPGIHLRAVAAARRRIRAHVGQSARDHRAAAPSAVRADAQGGRRKMTVLAKARLKILGKPLDPLNPKTRQHIALVAFLAWVGLGADGLSSSCYGPEEAFKALGEHTHLGLYLALATAATVFILSLAYNQVIELFPTGGGGYRVATRLIGRPARLVSGSALMLDYVLTIAISVASGVHAMF